MFDDTIRLIKETKDGLQATRKGVQQGEQAYKQLEEEIRLAKRRLAYKKSSRHAETYARRVLRQFKAEDYPKLVLMKEIDDAVVRSGREFDENSSLYKYYLYQVANDESIYKLIPIGAGWGIRLSPQIVFEEVAGTLNDYARGIEAYRASLGTKVSEDEESNRGLKATSWWRKNIYGSDKYEKTIEGRIGITGMVAPFWQLIAKGSTSLPSDRPDASYNPFPAKGVDFVESTEDIIKKEFSTRLGSERSIWAEETQAYTKEVQNAEKTLKEFESGLAELQIEYAKNRATLRKLGDNARYVSENKLAEAARRFRAGEEFDTERVELTAAGSPRRIRPTVGRFREILEY
jgi:hypothetical protein